MSSFRLPFSFDRYNITATFPDVDEPRDRRGRGERAWDLLDSGREVRVDVRIRDHHCVLHFDNGRYLGCTANDDSDEARERERFLRACAERVEEDSEDRHVNLSGPARRVLTGLLAEAS